jgi:uncharacterized membrane protein YfcA
MNPLATDAILAVVAFLAGAINSIAGGGSFLTFPALILAGVPPITANATNNAAMFVGTFGSIRGYREELRAYRRAILPGVAVSLLGGTAGAILLLRTPPSIFERMIPWLLLFAIVVFTLSPYLTRKVEPHDGGHLHSPWQLAGQFVVAIYGGYFGAGIGYLMLAILSFSGLPNMNAMNGVKNLMGSCINGVALIPFVIAGVVDWKYAILMSIFAVSGGYAGARVVRKIPTRYTRLAVIALGFSMTAYFFLKGNHG